MKKYLRWTGIAVASPFILFILLCILIYIPPIQNFLVNTATRYASEATGMQISIGRISLSFPLDLVVNNTVIIDKQDTILNAKKLTAKIQLTPLLRKKIELDGLELSKASVNTANLIEGMTLKGNLGELFVSSHGVELDPETAIVNTLSLKDTHLSICMADTTASDTTSSQPVFWKIQLKNVDFENVSFAMQMPLDTFSMSTSLEKLSLRNGLVDLHKSAYSAGSLKLTNGSAYLDTNTLPAAEGFDASHIGITNIKLDVDSAYYAGNDIYANIRDFNLKERSGLEIVSTKGKLVSDAKTLKVPSLQITTPDSYLEFSASMDWEATDAEKDGMINARLMADIGKNDLLKVITGMPEDFIKKYPSAPLQIRAGIDGNLKEIRLTTLSASIQDAFRAQATGSITLPMDSLQRNGNINLSVETGNLNFVESMLSGVVLPHGMKLEGEASVNGSLLGANMQFFPGKKANVILKADYDLQKEGYLVDLNIDSLNIHEFMPHDSIFGLSASLHAEGNGFDFFSPKTSALLKGEVSHFRYGSLLFSGVTLDAGLKHSQASMMLNVNNRAIDVSANLQALLRPNMIKADLNTHVRLLDWQALSLMARLQFVDEHRGACTDGYEATPQSTCYTVSGIQPVTAERNFRTKDLHAGFDMATDSVRDMSNAGDLTFPCSNRMVSLDKFMSKSDLVTKVWRAVEEKHINQLIREMLPSAQLKVFSGSDNPVANFLASQHVNYNRLRASFSTSPEDGLNGSIDLYGLRTDSLQLDTIYFKTLQDSVQVKFYSGVKALANKRQEAFDISLNGYIGSTDAQLAIGYLNGKRETGVDLGLKAQLRPNGISMHITPDNPTLVYRPFKVNPDNYIYLSDEGRIHADVKIYDENHSGLSLYSTPDSLVQQDLTVALNQIDIAEFRRIIPYMPDIAGFINAEAHYIQSESSMQVATDIGINNLAYSKQTTAGQLGNECRISA